MNNEKQLMHFQRISVELLLPGLEYMQSARNAEQKGEQQSWVRRNIEALREFKDECMDNMHTSVVRLSWELVKAYRSLEKLRDEHDKHRDVHHQEHHQELMAQLRPQIESLEKIVVLLKQGIGISRCSAWKETSWADRTLSSLEQELKELQESP